MIYYKNNKEVVEYNDNLRLINEGTQGKVYQINNDTCLKVYGSNFWEWNILEDTNSRFDPNMFEYFKSIDSKNIAKLHNILYDSKIETVLAYTMKYYEEMIINILEMPISYILDNFSLIYDLVDKLTKDCIKIVDMTCYNMINTNEGIVIIDQDKCYIDKENENLDYINKSALMYAFKGIFTRNLIKLGYSIDKNTKMKIESLFTINTSPITLECKLRKYKKGIDILYR